MTKTIKYILIIECWTVHHFLYLQSHALLKQQDYTIDYYGKSVGEEEGEWEEGKFLSLCNCITKKIVA